MDTATQIGVRPDNEYLGRTGTTPRPTAATHPGADGARLAGAQAAWDLADAWAKVNEKLRRERLAKLDGQRNAAVESRRRQEDERFTAELRAEYLSVDPTATDADFQRDLPELRRQHRPAAALKDAPDDGRARAAGASRFGAGL